MARRAMPLKGLAAERPSLGFAMWPWRLVGQGKITLSAEMSCPP